MTSPDDIGIEEGELLAGRATAGEWHLDGSKTISTEDHGGMRVGMFPRIGSAHRSDDAVFIAFANPQRILQWAAELKRLRILVMPMELARQEDAVRLAQTRQRIATLEAELAITREEADHWSNRFEPVFARASVLEAENRELRAKLRSKLERAWVLGGGSWLDRERMSAEVEHVMTTDSPQCSVENAARSAKESE